MHLFDLPSTSCIHLLCSIWYPLPFMRKIPLEGARALGRATRRSKFVPVIYIILVFFVAPLILLALSAMFEQKTVGFTVLGSFLVIFLLFFIARFVWWWKKQDGKARCLAWLDRREAMSQANATLPEDMKFLKSKINQLCEHTGLPVDEEEIEPAIDPSEVVKEPAKQDAPVVASDHTTPDNAPDEQA